MGWLGWMVSVRVIHAEAVCITSGLGELERPWLWNLGDRVVGGWRRSERAVSHLHLGSAEIGRELSSRYRMLARKFKFTLGLLVVFASLVPFRRSR